ncbi:MAG: archaemetzincin [Planctomycetota bacterium]
MRSILLLAFVAHMACCAEHLNPSDEDATKARVYASVSPAEEKGFSRMLPPKSGEWLFTYPEPAQSFEQYTATKHIRPTQDRRTIVIQPLGKMDAEKTKLLEDLREYAEVFFQLPARIEKTMELKLDDPNKQLTRKVPFPLRRGEYDTQYNADRLLDSLLIKRVPRDAAVYLGITMEDIYSGDLHYVFGLGDMQNRVGVYSLCRYFPEFWNQKRRNDADVTALRRSCKVLNHETGHMFGLPHCVFYKCSMNGSISLYETDAAPVHFCPVCQKKLLWTLGCDSEKRLESVQAFYAKHGMNEEAAFMESSLATLRKSNNEKRLRSVRDE